MTMILHNSGGSREPTPISPDKKPNKPIKTPPNNPGNVPPNRNTPPYIEEPKPEKPKKIV